MRAYPNSTANTSDAIAYPGICARQTPFGNDAFNWTERHLQCVWFDAKLRPAKMQTQHGETVEVEDPGQWNLEAGPDFLNASLRIGPDCRRIQGDVEIHVRPSDWRRHNHAGNPDYARVIAQVTFFPGQIAPAELPKGAVQIALKETLEANPFFCFESIDLAAYPYSARAPITPCARQLQTADPAQIATLLESAGAERIRRKTARLRAAMADKGPEQTLYEEILGALGYKNNRMPFRNLAERLPLEALRETTGGDTHQAYALLMGVAGLLPAKTAPRWDAPTRAFLRGLWDFWWKERARRHTSIMERKEWILRGLRPQNHPQRRLMAAALIFTQKPPLLDQLIAFQPEPTASSHTQMAALLQPTDCAYWQCRLAFGGAPQPHPSALIGARRISAMLTNVIVPFLAALGNQLVLTKEFLIHLPPEEDNNIARKTARHMFGADHNPALYRTGLRQQGLLQIFSDFCLNDRSRCRECSLAQTLAKLFPEK